ncbi:MAG TPA: tyrosine-type recombinase/integrase [Xanthobacteraceae bacterium]|nr:tyrosine-type recombinase/integrase [Xanthobacteraceae bacterium]
MAGQSHEEQTLSDAARTALHRFRDGHGEFVFGRFGFQAWDWDKRALDARVAEAGKPLEHWTLHDLRRTVATHMAELGVQPHIIEAVLNHVSGHKGGVAGIYNRARYEGEMREALQRWADHVEAITH